MIAFSIIPSFLKSLYFVELDLIIQYYCKLLRSGKADFDSFIDEILELVGPVLIEEEIDLPDFIEEFEQGVLFVKLHGSAKV